eukprot:173189_1
MRMELENSSFFCNDNAFEDEDVKEELNENDGNACTLTVFDPSFPFMEPTDDADKPQKILQVLTNIAQSNIQYVPNQHSEQISNELETLEEALKVIQQLEYEELECQKNYDYKAERQAINEQLNIFEEERQKINLKMKAKIYNREMAGVCTNVTQIGPSIDSKQDLEKTKQYPDDNKEAKSESYSSTKYDSETEKKGWNEYKENLKRLFYCFAGYQRWS